MFDIVNGKIMLSANSLAIPPFKQYYESKKDKVKAIKDIEYVIWLYKMNSPYQAYEPKVRAKVVAKDVFGTEKYTPSDEVKELANRFIEFQNTPLVRLYIAAENGLEYLIESLSLLKYGSHDEDALKVSKLLKEVEPISKSFENAKARAIAEQQDSGKVRGGGTIGLYERPRK